MDLDVHLQHLVVVGLRHFARRQVLDQFGCDGGGIGFKLILAGWGQIAGAGGGCTPHQ